MKLPLIIATLLLSLVTLATTAMSQKTCSCKAPDGSCSANVTCRENGCTSICGSNDGCYAACGKDMVLTRFTLKLVNKDSNEVVSALIRHTGKNIEFIPRDRKARFNIDIKDEDLWNAMEYLDQRGQLKINKVPWKEYRVLRKGMSHGSKVSHVQFNDISIKDALNHLSFLSGLLFRVESGDPEKLLSLSLREVTLNEVVARISEETNVKIKRTERSASTK
jgi:hypothetical protein